MNAKTKTHRHLLAENKSLRRQLEEAEEALRAMRSGEADALMVSTPPGEPALSLKGGEPPYRVLVENMNEGAATLNPEGTILYGNGCLAALLDTPIEKVVGAGLRSFVAGDEIPVLDALLAQGFQGSSQGEVHLRTATSRFVPVNLSVHRLPGDEGIGVSVIVTDLTEQKRNEAVVASEELAGLILEQAGDAIVVCDRSGVVVRANGVATRLCGENPLLQPVDGLFRLRQTNNGKPYSVTAALRGRVSEAMEAVLERADGTTLHLLVSAKPLREARGKIAGCVVTLTDITGSKAAEEALRKTNQRLAILSETASQLLVSPEPQEAVDSLCRMVMEHLDCQVFFNFLVDKDGARLRLNACAGIPEDAARRIERLELGAAICECVARDGERIVAENVQETPDPRADLIRSFGIQAYACHPLLAQEGRVIGTLSFGTRTRLRFTGDELALMKVVADQVAAATERIRLLEAERQRADEAEQSRQLLETIMEHTRTHLAYLDPEFNFVLANSAYVQGCGHSREELIGRNHFAWFPNAENEAIFRHVTDTGQPVEFRAKPFEYADQPERGVTYWDWTLSPVKDKGGKVVGLVFSLQDVTENVRARQRIELLAAESQRRAGELNAVLWQMPAGVVIAEAPSGKILLGNHQMDLIMGRASSESPHIEEYGDLTGFHPDGRPYTPEEWPLARSLHTGEVVDDEEITIRRVNGDLETVLVSSGPVRNQQQQIVAAVATFYDITERKGTEQEREEYLARLNTLLWVSTEILRERTIEGLLQRVADGARRLTRAKMAVTGHGYQQGGFQIGGVSKAEGAAPCPQGEMFSVQEGGVYLDLITKETSIRLTDEQLRRHPLSQGLLPEHAPLRGLLGTRLVGRGGEAVGLVMVTDREQGDFTLEDEMLLVQLGAMASLALQHIAARQDAERRADELDAVFGAMTDAVMVYDDSNRVVRANPAVVANLGFDPIHEQPRDLAAKLATRYPDGRPVALEDLPVERARRGQTVVDERYLLSTAHGHEMIVRSSVSPLWVNGKVSGVVSVWHDATERERAADKIRKLNAELNQRISELRLANQEMEAFSYSVSHDLRSPLAVIAGFSHVLLEEYAGTLDDEGKRFLNIISTNAQKMEQLIDDLLAFSRTGRKEVRPTAINMEELVQAVFEEIRVTAPGRVVELNLQALPPAHGDWSLLRQVVANLLSNAFKFTRPKDEARIEVGGETIGKENRYYVKDNGVGFDMAYAHKIFGVFQRLHSAEEFEGSGVGLAIVQRIVEKHGGRVWAEGKVGEGATLHFTLPCGPRAAE